MNTVKKKKKRTTPREVNANKKKKEESLFFLYPRPWGFKSNDFFFVNQEQHEVDRKLSYTVHSMYCVDLYTLNLYV